MLTLDAIQKADPDYLMVWMCTQGCMTRLWKDQDKWRCRATGLFRHAHCSYENASPVLHEAVSKTALLVWHQVNGESDETV